MEAFDMYRRLVRLYAQLREFQRDNPLEEAALDPEPGEPPSMVYLYVVDGDRVLVQQTIGCDEDEGFVTVPHGPVLGSKDFNAAALRLLKEHVSDRPFGITELGAKACDKPGPPHLRHYVLAEPVHRLPRRWTVPKGTGSIDFFWLPIEEARSLARGVGEFLPQLDQAA